VEVLIVVVVLGILAAIVVPQFADARQDSAASTLQTNLSTLKTNIDLVRAKTAAYPANIDASWFASGLMPTHPQNTFGVAAVETVSSAGTLHPASKVLKAGVAGAYWYNSAEGLVRARVSDQGSAAATLAFYNRVNNSNEADLGNYGGGGGS